MRVTSVAPPLPSETEDQRFAIGQTGRPLGKRGGDIGEVSD